MADKLGSFIGEYNFRYKKKKLGSDQYYHDDLLTIKKRLEGYDRYRKQVAKERKAKETATKKKLEKKVLKKWNKYLYRYKPIQNPYVEMYKRLKDRVDPKLLEKYTTENIFTLYEFRHLALPRSDYTISAGQAWGGLIKAWRGYKTSVGTGNDEMAVRYASATQKWNYLLEVPNLPDFPHIGISAEGFKLPDLVSEIIYKYEKTG